MINNTFRYFKRTTFIHVGKMAPYSFLLRKQFDERKLKTSSN